MRVVIVCACVVLVSFGVSAEKYPDFWRVAIRAAELQGAQAEFEEVLEHLAGVPDRRAAVPNRLALVDRALTEPWTPPEIAADMQSALARPMKSKRGADFEGLAGQIAEWLEVGELPELEELEAQWSKLEDSKLEGVELLSEMSVFMELCHASLSEALESLGEADRELLFGGHLAFSEAWYRRAFPGEKLGEEQLQDLSSFATALLASPKQDRALILGVTDIALRLSGRRFTSGLNRRLGKVRTEGAMDEFGVDARAVVGDGVSNRVVLLGRGTQTCSVEAALVIDLGGDDRYEDAATVKAETSLIRIVLDLGGDDEYVSAERRPCYAAGGVALLIDVEGDDSYRSGRLGQAASTLGCAVLIDLEGNDQYVAEDYSQGHALCGVALLYDLRGNDTYRAWAFAQGATLGYGLSALVDGDGDDEYLADLKWPDVYGNSGPDVYHGASQGYGTGIRPSIAGGLACLVDLGEGADRYQSGSFSQGGGYYFSFGLMYDGGGDDENFGSRYSQGFGVHQAVGVRWDVGGNDKYTCRSVAHTGMAWDEGVGYFIDDAGDDEYRVGDLGCGGAAQTGIAVFLEGGGKDFYKTGKESLGGAGSSEYHEKPAVGLFLDLGGSEDQYSMEGRQNEHLRVTTGVEIFLDSSARDEQAALKSRLLRKP